MMTRGDTARLLSLAASFDQRTIGEADVAAWHDVLVLLDFDECAFAVRRHYASETRRVMPADVMRTVRAQRYDRTQRSNVRALPRGPVTFDEDGHPVGAKAAREALRASRPAQPDTPKEPA